MCKPAALQKDTANHEKRKSQNVVERKCPKLGKEAILQTNWNMELMKLIIGKKIRLSTPSKYYKSIKA